MLLGQWRCVRASEDGNVETRKLTELDVQDAFGSSMAVTQSGSKTVFTHQGIRITVNKLGTMYYKILSIEVLGFQQVGAPAVKKVAAFPKNMGGNTKKPVTAAKSSSPRPQTQPHTAIIRSDESASSSAPNAGSPDSEQESLPATPSPEIQQQRADFVRKNPKMALFDPSSDIVKSRHAELRTKQYDPSRAKADAQNVFLCKIKEKDFYRFNTNRGISDEEIREALNCGSVAIARSGIRYTLRDLVVITDSVSKKIITVYRDGDESSSETNRRMLRRAEFNWYAQNYSAVESDWVPSGHVNFNKLQIIPNNESDSDEMAPEQTEMKKEPSKPSPSVSAPVSAPASAATSSTTTSVAKSLPPTTAAGPMKPNRYSKVPPRSAPRQGK
jgi:hypothetical protein